MTLPRFLHTNPVATLTMLDLVGENQRPDRGA